jgi:glycosyltransferase involved in cell wall biosynthesis
LGWITAREARLQGVPCLIEVVGNALETSQLHGSWLGKIVGYFEHGLSRFEIRKAKTVVYITENYLQSVYPTDGRSFVCPNVRVIRISESQMAEQQRARPRTTNPRIGLIGSLNVNYKGHDVAIDVLKLLLERYNLNGATLEFAGGGDPARWQELARQKNVQNQVRIHGAIAAGEAIMRWIDEMDILLQPSLTEGQGRAIIEAMSRGRPVVASNAGGIPELLDGDWMAEPKDVDRIAERCALLLS